MKPPQFLSQTVEYALRALLFVASRAPHPARIPDIAAEIHAPPRYLSKILGQLAREGFLESTRGPSGGFRVTPRLRRASLASIIAVFEEPRSRRCLLGHGVCGQTPECVVHARWAAIAESSAAFFAHTTLLDLLAPHSHHEVVP